MAKRGERGKAYYMISAVSQKYDIHPQTLRLYEREGLLKPSRTEGNTRLTGAAGGLHRQDGLLEALGHLAEE
jgi:hypothetical protein